VPISRLALTCPAFFDPAICLTPSVSQVACSAACLGLACSAAVACSAVGVAVVAEVAEVYFPVPVALLPLAH
jgi:hypothetical protein